MPKNTSLLFPNGWIILNQIKSFLQKTSIPIVTASVFLGMEAARAV